MNFILSSKAFLRSSHTFILSRTMTSLLKDSLLDAIPANSFLTKGPIGTSSMWLHVNTAKNYDQWSFQQPLQFASKSLLCLHRWKIWWMIPRVVEGKHAQGKVPSETYLLVAKNQNDEFMVMIPIIDQDMSFSLEGSRYGSDDQSTVSSEVLVLNGFKNAAKNSINREEADKRAMLIITGQTLHDTVETGYQIIRSQLRGEEYVSEAKSIVDVAKNHYLQVNRIGPKFAGYFGWCTWDSCYTNLSKCKVEAGLQSFAEIGVVPRFLIIDDGWQDTNVNDCNNGHQWQGRLKSYSANFKFSHDYVPCETSSHGPKINRRHVPDLSNSFEISHLVRDVKDKYNIESLLVWHAFAGYWLGADPESPHLKDYEINVELPNISPSLSRMSKNGKLKEESFNHKGIGVVHPKQAKEFYDAYHKQLKAMGVDGVKVDVQSAIPLMQHVDHSSWDATLHYHTGLQNSIQRHFSSTAGADSEHSIIHCMSHAHETMLAILAKYDVRQSAPIIRGSDDYWPSIELSHAPHLFVNAMNSLMMNNFGLHDWDMFQTDMGKPSMFHAAARAVSGGPVYVSDKAGTHDPTVLRAMALSNGLVPRCLRNARPVQNLIFDDPQRNAGMPLLLQNINPAGGFVIAGFNVFGSVVENDFELYRKVEAKEVLVSQRVCPLVNDVDSRGGNNIVFDVDVSMVDECRLYAQNRLNEVQVSVDSVASTKDFVVHSYKMQTMKEMDIDSSFPMKLSGSFDFDILSYASKHFLKNKPANWIAVIGNVGLLNPGGCVVAVELGAKDKKLAIRIRLLGNCNRCSVAAGLTLANAQIADSSVKIKQEDNLKKVDCGIINTTGDKDAVQTLELLIDENDDFENKNILETEVFLEFDV